ncbi:MAG: type II toxin-antitoxin system PemK/MazF family toxin [Trueperaceae bacterium]|nr:MAG: type II toxin-antitoxin system PemK/MazF family toxin [Trueperaceae bacterium]
MTRGKVWWVDFGPSVGGEIQKRRPAVIISNDAANRHLNRVQVVPLTSKTERVYPSEAVILLAGKPGKAMADQLTTASKKRLISKIGVLPATELSKVEHAIRVQLGLVAL